MALKLHINRLLKGFLENFGLKGDKQSINLIFEVSFTLNGKSEGHSCSFSK